MGASSSRHDQIACETRGARAARLVGAHGHGAASTPMPALSAIGTSRELRCLRRCATARASVTYSVLSDRASATASSRESGGMQRGWHAVHGPCTVGAHRVLTHATRAHGAAHEERRRRESRLRAWCLRSLAYGQGRPTPPTFIFLSPARAPRAAWTPMIEDRQTSGCVM